MWKSRWTVRKSRQESQHVSVDKFDRLLLAVAGFAEAQANHLKAFDLHRQRMDSKIAAIEKRLDKLEGIY